MCACVKPCKAASEKLHLEVLLVEELLVDGSDLEFSSRRWLDVFGHFDDFVGIEVQSHHGVVALWVLWFLLDGEAVAIAVKLCHTISLGVVDPIAKDAGLAFLGFFDALMQHARESASMEDVVAKNQADVITTYKLFANDEGLRKAIG